MGVFQCSNKEKKLIAFIHGKDATMSFDGTVITAFTDSVSFSREVDTAETTVFGVTGDAKTYIAGLNGATMTFGGKYDATLAAVLNGAIDGSSVLFDYSPDGVVNYTGSAFLTNWGADSPVGGADTWTASAIVTGVVTVA